MSVYGVGLRGDRPQRGSGDNGRWAMRRRGETYTLQDLDLAHDALHLCIILALELVEDGITVLAPMTH